MLEAVVIFCRSFPHRNQRHLECIMYSYERWTAIKRKKDHDQMRPRIDSFIIRGVLRYAVL